MAADITPVVQAAEFYGDTRAAEQVAIDQAAIDAANARTTTAQAQTATLQAQFDAYKAAHPDTPPPVDPPVEPPPTGTYGGTTGWGAARVVDLSKEPTGTTYTNGVRTNTDQSFNRKSQATWGSGGLTVTAEKISGVIYSADVMMRGVDVPPVFAVEADIEMQGTGMGMGHAFWFRPMSGQGEIDTLEYIGSNAGKGISGGAGQYEAKYTLINTGSSPYNQGSKAGGIPPLPTGGYNGLRRYRAELTPTQYSEWVDGKLAGTITKAQFEAAAGAGKWSQFSGSTHWYPRLTLQTGNGTSAKLWGNVPSTFTKATIRLGALRIYAKA